MKNFIITLIILMSTPKLFFGQTASENYIQTKTYLEPVTVSNLTPKRIETIKYLDKLGRVKQIVNVQASPLGKDVVTHIEYNDFGKQTKDYLEVPQLGTQNGNIYQSPLTNAPSIYGLEKIYTERIIEKSPLNRLQQKTNAGNDWGNKPIKYEDDINSDEEVRKYDSNITLTNGVPNYKITLSGYYNVGQLHKNSVKDEDGNEVIVFKNLVGLVQLIRKNDGTRNIDTYYVYDNYDQLTYIIPPAASALSSLDENSVNNLCYQFRYDKKRRLVEKKLPGKGWEYMVYNKADQLILTQDTVLKGKGQWLFTKYDQFGRTIYTGITNNAASRASMQNSINANANLYETRTATPGFTLNGLPVYYTKLSTPTGLSTLLSVNYYDSYPTYSFNPTFPSTVQGEPILSETPTSDGRSTKSLLVMSLVKNVEDDSWTKNYSYYDKKGRVIGSHSINHMGGYTHTESTLDFTGVTKQTVTKHKRLDTDTERVITETFDYDNQNRLLVHKHQVDSNPTEILAQNTYNEISQVINKKVGGTDLASPLQSVDYKYNIRGWLTRINDPAALNGKLFGYEIKYTNPVYTNLASGKYNGNIAEVDWRNASEGALKRYSYTYDPLNRLKDAIYTEPGATNPYNNNFNENLTYDVNGNIMTLKRNAYPVSGTTATQVDDLEYKYIGNRLNQVIENSPNNSGYEGGNNIIGYDLNGNMTDMKDKEIQSIVYNHLNLPASISMQFTNPVGNISTTNVNHLYRADGVKLRKTYSQQAHMGLPTTRVTDYLDGFQYSYEDDGGICITCKTESAYEVQAYSKIIGPIITKPSWQLDFVPTSEGFYSFAENRYIYNYKDHLGNVRVSFGKNNAGVVQTMDVNNYYPFGLNHIGGSNYSNFGSYYNYKYQEQELQETGFYSFKWRNYMPDLGRFFNIDPLSEAYAYQSHYNFSENRVIDARELEGLEMMKLYDPPAEEGAKYDGLSYDGGIDSITSYSDGTKETNISNVSLQGKRAAPTLGSALFSTNSFSLGEAARFGAGFVPIVGSGLDIYEGARDGNWVQFGFGIGGLALDVVTLGSGSILKGGIKTIGTELVEEGLEKATKEVAEQTVAAEIKGAGIFVVDEAGEAISTSQSRMIESFNNAGFSKKAATETAESGVIYTVPSRHGTVNVRAMEGNSKNYRRSVFTDGKNTKDYRKIGGGVFNGPTPKLNRIIGSHLEQIK